MKRYEGNPILSQKDIPYPAWLIFNAGVIRFHGEYLMLFRNDYSLKEGGTNLGLARSKDGIHFQADPKPCFAWKDEEITRIYDPRLQEIEGELYLCFACDTHHGVRGGIAKIQGNFESLEVLSLSAPDNRNMVLFPERFEGHYLRLERPFPMYSAGGEFFDIWMNDSPDLRYWGSPKLLLRHEDVPFATTKIGPAAPPIKTKEGWLTTFHAVKSVPGKGKCGYEAKWEKEYYAGVMLLDLFDPSKVVGFSKKPILSPTTSYEHQGFRGDVIFPGGMILEDDGSIKLYYGAADTTECLAFTSVDELLALCHS
ncbi:MAG: glycoside hydrolase family 130 protein [Erysipelotrichaceae bacterium]|nr:glycoside hydrolase family 130 protein [Erysipelotrichaceae bacterium]